MSSDNLSIPITKLQWGLRGSQIFFAFLSMACIAAVIAFDNKFMSGSLFSVAHIFIMIVSMFFAALIVGIPHIYLEYGKCKSTARALRVPRTEFVLTAIWGVLIFIVSVALTIEVSLRNCDPYSADFQKYNTGDNNDTFIGGLARNCRTERAGVAFGWFCLIAWLTSLVLIGIGLYKNRRQPIPHKDEVTMHSNSTTSSLEVPTTATIPPN
ncbi:4722_t:CDS:2 [Diversispora eburnea]|uniref:4722_t:CDS:1 n=2 Tax=Diversisporales TaxID=214509 RepID=A0A9N8V0D9_9GLOM|nr:4722_t:CDS:2 [Diversispora eburnea]